MIIKDQLNKEHLPIRSNAGGEKSLYCKGLMLLTGRADRRGRFGLCAKVAAINLGAPQEFELLLRNCGKRMTSRIEGESVKSITSLSMPMPSPAVGGSPYSRALT